MINNEKGFGIAEIILTVVVAGLMIALGMVFLDRQKGDDDKKESNTGTNQTQTSAATPTPAEVIEKIRSTYASKYELVDLDKNNQPSEGELAVRSGTSSPRYKTKGYPFYTDTENGVSIDLMSHNSDTTSLPYKDDVTIRSEIIKIYEEFGLRKTETQGADIEGGGEYIYTGKDLVCSIQVPKSSTSTNTAQCGTVESYKEMAKKVKPFADVLSDLTPNTALTNLKIDDSLVSGYQKAELSMSSVGGVGGAAGLFYKKDGESWKFWKGTQNALQCSEYNTLDLKNAFKGDTCFDTTGQQLKVQ